METARAAGNGRQGVAVGIFYLLRCRVGMKDFAAHSDTYAAVGSRKSLSLSRQVSATHWTGWENSIQSGMFEQERLPSRLPPPDLTQSSLSFERLSSF